MTSNPTVKVRAGKGRRRLSPSEKYEIFVQVLTGQASQRKATDWAGVDRSTGGAHRLVNQGALDALRCRAGGDVGVGCRVGGRAAGDRTVAGHGG